MRGAFSRMVLAGLFAGALAGCDDPCGNEPLSAAASPDGKTVATAFERNCGATTGYVRAVTLRPAGTTIDYADQNAWVLTLKGQPSVTLRWEQPKALAIELSGEREVFAEKARWNDVAITRR